MNIRSIGSRPPVVVEVALRTALVCLRTALVLGLIACAAFPAEAQARIAGPFAGLFGGRERPRNSQALDFRASLFGVRQDALVPADVDPALIDPIFQRSSTFGATNGSLEYAFNRQGDNARFSFGGHGWVADYSVRPKDPQLGFDANAGLSASTNLTRRLVLTSSGLATYSPYYNFSPYNFTPGSSPLQNPLDPLTPGLGVAAVAAANVGLNGTIGLVQTLTARSTISADLSAQETYFFDQATENTVGWTSGVRFTHRLSKKLDFYVGYRRSGQVRLGNSTRDSPPSEGIDAGVNFSDALSLTRRTTLTFASTVAGVKDRGGDNHYRLLGNVNVTHNLGRSWGAGAGVSRNMEFVAGFRDPLLSDSATATVGGQLGPRVNWTNTAYLTRGQVGFNTAERFLSYAASSGLSFAIARSVQAFAQYSYYRNQLPAGSTTLNVLSSFSGRTASVGVSFFAPILHSRRNRP